MQGAGFTKLFAEPAAAVEAAEAEGQLRVARQSELCPSKSPPMLTCTRVCIDICIYIYMRVYL